MIIPTFRNTCAYIRETETAKNNLSMRDVAPVTSRGNVRSLVQSFLRQVDGIYG